MSGERTKFTTQELLNINSDQEVSPPRLVVGVAKLKNSTTYVADGVGTIGNGRKTISSAGTAERLVASSTPVKWAVICGLEANTDVSVLGGSGVKAATAQRNGMQIFPGGTEKIEDVDLYDVFLDVGVNDEGVSFIYCAY